MKKYYIHTAITGENYIRTSYNRIKYFIENHTESLHVFSVQGIAEIFGITRVQSRERFYNLFNSINFSTGF